MKTLLGVRRPWRSTITGLVVALVLAPAVVGCAQQKSRTAEVDQVTDVGNPRALAAIADSIFIGVVEEQVGTESLGQVPETQYRVRVSQRLKGPIGDEVIVNQLAGERPDGSRFSVEGDEPLQPGQEYLFAALTHPNGKWQTVADVHGTLEIGSAAERSELATTYRDAIANPLSPEEMWKRKPGTPTE
ncbi:hypothetical protein AB0P36_29090 [Streptomyces flavidovirens]|uniref:hypothetical protein n=1 Tax=Streptomyces flavidovirens TaxID=67298 RepID=UPI00342E7C5D